MPQVTTFVGIDVAKDKLDVHVDPSGAGFVIPNSAAGVRQLVRRLAPDAVVALEASGGYARTAAEGLAQAGLSVLCLHQQRAALKGQLTRLATRISRTVLARLIATLEADIRRLETAMAIAIERNPRLRDKARRIQTVPGAGPVLAATLTACMPELGTLTSRQAASLTGVAPHPRQSGTSRPRGRCQGGRAPVRTVLYMATLAAIRCKTSSLRAFYQRLRANGKPFKLAIVAAMRKFIITLNTLLRNHQDWHPQPT